MYCKGVGHSLCPSPHICVLNGKDGESSNHIFLLCTYAREIWDHLANGVNFHWVMPEMVNGFYPYGRKWEYVWKKKVNLF